MAEQPRARWGNTRLMLGAKKIGFIVKIAPMLYEGFYLRPPNRWMKTGSHQTHLAAKSAVERRLEEMGAENA